MAHYAVLAVRCFFLRFSIINKIKFTIMSEQKIKVKELVDNTDNLCNYCSQNYPECISRIRFGVGLGDDNIVGCTSFDEDISDMYITENEYTKDEFESIYED